MANTIGKGSAYDPSWQLPPCQWRKCRDAARTTGLYHGSLVNLCDRHKAMSDRQCQRRGK